MEVDHSPLVVLEKECTQGYVSFYGIFDLLWSGYALSQHFNITLQLLSYSYICKQTPRMLLINVYIIAVSLSSYSLHIFLYARHCRSQGLA